MPIMSLSQFKELTKKSFSLRNGAIGQIDTALRDYHSPPATGEKLRKLRSAVDAFKNEKNLKFAPAYAAVNADNYGQFASAFLQHGGG